VNGNYWQESAVDAAAEMTPCLFGELQRFAEIRITAEFHKSDDICQFNDCLAIEGRYSAIHIERVIQ